MCEYTYESGKRCRLKSLEGSKYCALHISYDEGERLFGEDIKRIKEEAFLKRLKEGQT
ncbi:two pore domain potassium channel family protein, partial [Thermococcus sp. GR4]|nr:two pore domain potassium channel family protein [Thermococcus sp. GR4]